VPNIRIDPEYDTSGIHFDLSNPLSTLQKELVSSCFPPASLIDEAEFVRNEWLPCPIRVIVSQPDGTQATVYVRMERAVDGVNIESKLLPLLSEQGLPVPRLLAGPVIDPQFPDIGAVSVISAVPGFDIGEWSWGAGPEELAIICRLIMEAVSALHEVTPVIEKSNVAALLPRISLQDELEFLLTTGSPWLLQPEYSKALDTFLAQADRLHHDLKFTNGDLNPGNFLTNGRQLTGLVDFARARFEDPVIGFAKYWIYNFAPILEAGLEQHLYAAGFSKFDVLTRRAIRSLTILQRESVPVEGRKPGQEQYRERLLGFVRAGCELFSS